ncbi:hypothetical protein [Phyllobacterium sp. P30BS-XVII]|uniref:hypothetical protein n=1 Tax=Phyllobacterium sp. P30BS-XVII TaxID=2587046 RepID=UPI0015FC0BCC|nr:hypothetical protein [Phyllobacterium sp. P30BS-XVII]MBA8901185.1 hypothetical protein [Phyllobacterium sp. P30BS-XVII]
MIRGQNDVLVFEQSIIDVPYRLCFPVMVTSFSLMMNTMDIMADGQAVVLAAMAHHTRKTTSVLSLRAVNLFNRETGKS